MAVQELLFQEDAFSNSVVNFTEVEQSRAEPLLAALTSNYALGEIWNIKEISSFGINSSNWKVESSTGEYVLKKLSTPPDESWTLQAKWVKDLHRKGFPVPEFIESTTNEYTCEYSGNFFCLTRFVGGNRFSGTSTEWMQTLEVIARLLTYLKTVNEIPSPLFPKRDFYTLNEFEFLQFCQSESKLFTLYKEAMDDYRSKCNTLTNGIFHIDLHPHNLLFENERLQLIADFDSFQNTDVEVSLGFGIFKCFRQVLVHQLKHSDQKLTSIIQMHAKQFDLLFPTLNMQNVLALARADVLKRLCGILKEMASGPSKWEFVLPIQRLALKEIDYIIATLK